jgi:hypothetical protein
MRWAALLVLLAWSVSGRTAPPPKKALPKTVVYDVTAVIGNSLVATVDDLAKLIFTSTRPEAWKVGKEGSSSLEILQETKLQIRTTPALHEEIADLLDNLRRLTGLHISFEGDVHEVSRETFNKHLAPLVAKEPVALVGVETAGLIEKEKSRVRIISANVPPGKTGVIYSQRQAFSFVGAPPWERERHATGFHGFRVRATADVTPDRRAVRLKLSRELTELRAINEEQVFRFDASGIEGKGKIEVPDLREEIQTANLKLDDGATLLFVLPRTSRLARESDKVRVLLMRVVISIEEEKKAGKNDAQQK